MTSIGSTRASYASSGVYATKTTKTEEQKKRNKNKDKCVIHSLTTLRSLPANPLPLSALSPSVYIPKEEGRGDCYIS